MSSHIGGNGNGNGNCNGGCERKTPDAAATAMAHEWATAPRWHGIVRPYSAQEVCRLRGSVSIGSAVARLGAGRLWDLLHTEPAMMALGALTGNQAMHIVRAGLAAIYLKFLIVAAHSGYS